MNVLGYSVFCLFVFLFIVVYAMLGQLYTILTPIANRIDCLDQKVTDERISAAQKVIEMLTGALQNSRSIIESQGLLVEKLTSELKLKNDMLSQMMQGSVRGISTDNDRNDPIN